MLQAAEVQQEAALLLGRLSLSEACKGAIRGHFGIVTLLKMLDRAGLDRSSKEVVVRTLSILAVDNEVNQDHIRCAEAMHCQYTVHALLYLVFDHADCSLTKQSELVPRAKMHL